MIELNESPVIFDPVQHTYTLDGKRLQGITHVIKDKLFPNEYKSVPESVLAKAAERGHRIHTALELYDNFGIETMCCPELDNYIKAREEFPWLANHLVSEYIVSDEKQYASGIDKVYQSGDGVILADIKTTYKLNLDYVSWQLNIYAYLFELQNPNVKAKDGYVIWLRGDKIKIESVYWLKEESIIELLYGKEIPRELRSCEDIDEVGLLRLKEEAEKAVAAYDAAKNRILERMATDNVPKIDGDIFTINLRRGLTRKSFDTKAFKADHPEDYEKYVTVQEQKPSITIRMKNG